MNKNQQEAWIKHATKIKTTDIINQYNNPSVFQIELASLINSICEENRYNRVIEVGCESGITNMLLNRDLDKYFLDLNDDILVKVQQACKQLNIIGKYIFEDMFRMSCDNEFYDVLFNSGVIEHFNKIERIKILQEYSRVIKQKGTIIIGIPNHYSFPYRSAYLLKKKILRGFQWPWPEEFKIKDLMEELKETNLQLVDRTVLDKETIFHFWNFFFPIKKLLRWSDYLFKYEGYLTTLVIRKRS